MTYVVHVFYILLGSFPDNLLALLSYRDPIRGVRGVGWVGGGPSAQFLHVYAAEDAKGIHWRRCLRDWVRVAILNLYQRIVLTQALEWKVYSILLVKKDKNIKIPNVFKSFFRSALHVKQISSSNDDIHWIFLMNVRERRQKFWAPFHFSRVIHSYERMVDPCWILVI